MSQFRRQDDRRRRVLMTAASATAARPTTASRSRLESMREARRPTLVYGTRVRQGLRGRWFSLVPVERSALAKLLAAVSAVVLVIVLMNDASVRSGSIASQPAFVNVFQVIRPGSLGRYVIGVMYLILAGAAWMVFQLRRFRNDDFRGNYRLWQWIVGVSLVSSIATVVPLLAMFGAGVELLMGRRIALSGHDWIGLFLVVGGAILALRTAAEMWQYRSSLSMSIGGWFFAAIPVAAQWNMIAVDTNLRWSIVTAAPLLAVSLWFAATVTYLRSLYREVRGIERSAGFLQRFKDIAPRPFTRARSSDTANSSFAEDEPTPFRKTAAKAKRPAGNEGAAAGSGPDRTDKPASPRRWFGLLPPAKPRAAKPKPDALGTTKPSPEKTRAGSTKRSVAAETDVSDDDDSQNHSRDEDSMEESKIAAEAKPNRRWWPSLRRRAKPHAVAETADDEGEENSAVEEAVAQPKKRRFGLGAVMKGNRNTPSDDAGMDEENGRTTSPKRSDSSSAAKSDATADGPTADADEDNDDDSDEEGYSDEDGYSEEDIDWSSMNKAERRRMRKQLKRGGKAA